VYAKDQAGLPELYLIDYLVKQIRLRFDTPKVLRNKVSPGEVIMDCNEA